MDSHNALTSPAEQAGYLKCLLAVPVWVRARVERLLELPEPYRNVALLYLAEWEPGLMERAMACTESLGCLGCAHPRHDAGACLVAGVSADGREDTYCLCGAPGPGPEVEVFSEEVRLVQEELADRAWESHVDVERQAAEERAR